MGKVDVGGGKPLAPSPKQPVAAPAPKHVAAAASFPKPSPYRGAAPHRAVSHNAGYGPRPTGSGVHARVQAQPVQSHGHSAAVARLASKLAQQTPARPSQATSARMSMVQQFLRSQPQNLWSPTSEGVASGAFSVNTAVNSLMRDVGVSPPKQWWQGRGADGEYRAKPLVPDSLGRPAPNGQFGHYTHQIPIPLAPVAQGRQLGGQQRALGFRAPGRGLASPTQYRARA